MTVSLSRENNYPRPRHARPGPVRAGNLRYTSASTPPFVASSSNEVALPFDVVFCTNVVIDTMNHPNTPRMGLMTALNIIERNNRTNKFNREFWLHKIVYWAHKNDFIQFPVANEFYALSESVIELTNRNWLFVDVLRAFVTSQLILEMQKS